MEINRVMEYSFSKKEVVIKDNGERIKWMVLVSCLAVAIS